MNVPHNDPPPQEAPPQAHPHHEDLQVRGPFPTFGMVVNGGSRLLSFDSCFSSLTRPQHLVLQFVSKSIRSLYNLLLHHHQSQLHHSQLLPLQQLRRLGPILGSNEILPISRLFFFCLLNVYSSTTPVLPINEAIVLELVSLGFHRVRAENGGGNSFFLFLFFPLLLLSEIEAVYLSGNSTTEAAALHLLEHSVRGRLLCRNACLYFFE